MTLAIRNALVVCATFAFACIPETTAPPLRPVHVEPPSVLDRGRTAILGQVAERASFTQPPMDSWTVRVRHGFGDNIEGSIEASYAHDAASERTPATASAIMFRAGARYRFWNSKGRHHGMGTFFAGAGGGGFDRGTLFGGDLGLVIGTDVVFFMARAWLSEAIGAAAVDDGTYTPFCILCAEQPVAYRNVPRLAGGIDTMVGVQAPLASGSDRALRVLAGAGFVHTFGIEYHPGVAITAALEYEF